MVRQRNRHSPRAAQGQDGIDAARLGVKLAAKSYFLANSYCRSLPHGEMENPKSQIRPHLDPGEQLLWSGRPRQGIVMQAADAYMIPFALIWTAGVTLWTLMALGSVLTSKGGDPIVYLFLAVGLWMTLSGLYMLIGRYFADAYMRARTVYGLTNRRALILSRTLGAKVTSVGLDSLQNRKLEELSSGRGTIHLTQPTTDRKSPWAAASRTTPMFFQIRDARKVFETMRRAIENSQ